MAHVCSWRHVRMFDNFLRPLIHNPQKMFGPYVQPGMTVMDIGCGAGFASIGLAKMVGEGGKVFAVDLQPEMLEMVRKRAEKAGLLNRLTPHLCEAEDFKLNLTFNFVNAFYMVHEVPNTEGFLKQIKELLHPEGKFFITEPVFHVTKNGFESMLDKARGVGFAAYDRPRVRFSRTVVLSYGL